MSGCTLDTDVVIAALDRADSQHERAAGEFRRWLELDTRLLLCTINYAEALVRPAADPQALEAAVDAIAALGIEPAIPTPAIARDAAKQRGLGVSLADGFALATAGAEGTAIASFDKRVVRAASELGLELGTSRR